MFPQAATWRCADVTALVTSQQSSELRTILLLPQPGKPNHKLYTQRERDHNCTNRQTLLFLNSTTVHYRCSRLILHRLINTWLLANSLGTAKSLRISVVLGSKFRRTVLNNVQPIKWRGGSLDHGSVALGPDGVQSFVPSINQPQSLTKYSVLSSVLYKPS